MGNQAAVGQTGVDILFSYRIGCRFAQSMFSMRECASLRAEPQELQLEIEQQTSMRTQAAIRGSKLDERGGAWGEIGKEAVCFLGHPRHCFSCLSAVLSAFPLAAVPLSVAGGGAAVQQAGC